jgi:2-isopropylmalate synthase
MRQIERAVIWRHKRKGLLFLSDTTLRDGEQMPGVRLSPDDKVAISKALAEAGIHSIDAGSPAAAPVEVEAVGRIIREVRGPVITAHCRTLNSDIDIVAEALQGVRPFKRGITLFVGISPIHREHKHRKSKAEILRMTVDAITYAKRYFHIVTFGPEDAGRTEPEYLHELYREAISAGATTVGFADTVGISTTPCWRSISITTWGWPRPTRWPAWPKVSTSCREQSTVSVNGRVTHPWKKSSWRWPCTATSTPLNAMSIHTGSAASAGWSAS